MALRAKPSTRDAGALSIGHRSFLQDCRIRRATFVS